MQKLSFSVGSISRVELFVKKYNCRNVSVIQDASETTVNHLFMSGEPAWLAELASLTSLSRGETFGGVAKCLRLQRSTT